MVRGDLVVCLDCRSTGRRSPAGEQDNGGEAGDRSERWGHHVEVSSFLACLRTPCRRGDGTSAVKSHATEQLDRLAVPGYRFAARVPWRPLFAAAWDAVSSGRIAAVHREGDRHGLQP
jgi:hypothetical protein